MHRLRFATLISLLCQVIPNELLTFVQCIGKGQFGEVHLGLLHDRNQSQSSPNAGTKVAIKILPGEFLERNC